MAELEALYFIVTPVAAVGVPLPTVFVAEHVMEVGSNVPSFFSFTTLTEGQSS